MSSMVSGDTAGVAVSAVYQGVSETLKRTMTESKIGQRVPHLDTPPLQFGYSWTKRLAACTLRSPTVPLPKLSQLESLSDLHHVYGECYPQRLDLACAFMAVLPLLALKIQKDVTIYMYVGPFSKVSSEISRVSHKVSSNVKHMTRQTGTFLSRNSRMITNVVLTQEHVQKYVLDILVRYNVMTRTPIDKAIAWSAEEVADDSSLSTLTSRAVSSVHTPEEKTEFANQNNTGFFGGPSKPVDESFVHVDDPLKRNPFMNRLSNMVPGSWFGSPQKPRKSQDNSHLYKEIRISKKYIQNALKFVGFGYCVPALIFPQHVLFGFHVCLARCKGPLQPGQKIYHPLEELVTMLPSMSSPSRDAENGGWMNGMLSSYVGIASLVAGCGLIGVFFGKPGRLV